MGFFSWKTSDTDQAVRNRYTKKGATPCQVFLPDGDVIKCNDYEGYGDFTDQVSGRTIDFYEECAKFNGAGDNRDKGINIGLNKPEGAKLPKIASAGFKGTWEDLENSKEADCQGYW